jgi:hypothetical protein
MPSLGSMGWVFKAPNRETTAAPQHDIVSLEHQEGPAL